MEEKYRKDLNPIGKIPMRLFRTKEYFQTIF
jgi:hypothetical protein